jgi:hypothetical protein
VKAVEPAVAGRQLHARVVSLELEVELFKAQVQGLVEQLAWIGRELGIEAA